MRAPTKDEAKDTFLTTLSKPIRMTVDMLDFTGQTTNKVINRVLQLEMEDIEETMSMTSLRPVSPWDDKY